MTLKKFMTKITKKFITIFITKITKKIIIKIFYSFFLFYFDTKKFYGHFFLIFIINKINKLFMNYKIQFGLLKFL